MLSEEKIKKMIRLSDYENGQGGTDLQCMKYMKMDYIRMQILKTFLRVTVAVFLIAVLSAMYFMEYLMGHALALPYRLIGIYVGGFFLVLQVIFIIVTYRVSKRKYEESSLRVKEYYTTLHDLLDLYDKEEQGQEGEGL